MMNMSRLFTPRFVSVVKFDTADVLPMVRWHRVMADVTDHAVGRVYLRPGQTADIRLTAAGAAEVWTAIRRFPCGAVPNRYMPPRVD